MKVQSGMDNPVTRVTLGKIHRTNQTHNTEMRIMDPTKIPWVNTGAEEELEVHVL